MPLSSHTRSRLQATVAALIALGLWFWLGGLFATCVLIVAGGLAVLAWFAPRAHVPVQRVLDRAARVLAAAVSWILLGLAYVVLFVPLRLWRAVSGSEPLGLRRDVRAASYLHPLPPPRPGRFGKMY